MAAACLAAEIGHLPAAVGSPFLPTMPPTWLASRHPGQGRGELWVPCARTGGQGTGTRELCPGCRGCPGAAFASCFAVGKRDGNANPMGSPSAPSARAGARDTPCPTEGGSRARGSWHPPAMPQGRVGSRALALFVCFLGVPLEAARAQGVPGPDPCLAGGWRCPEVRGTGWAGPGCCCGWEVAAPQDGDIPTLAGKGVSCLEGAAGTGMGAACVPQWGELWALAVPRGPVLGVVRAQLTGTLASSPSSAGFVVGHAGLYQALAMFAVAYFIIGMTVLSVCAIATNGALDAGGAYCILCCGCCQGRARGPKSGHHPVALGATLWLAPPWPGREGLGAPDSSLGCW